MATTITIKNHGAFTADIYAWARSDRNGEEIIDNRDKWDAGIVELVTRKNYVIGVPDSVGDPFPTTIYNTRVKINIEGSVVSFDQAFDPHENVVLRLTGTTCKPYFNIDKGKRI